MLNSALSTVRFICHFHKLLNKFHTWHIFTFILNKFIQYIQTNWIVCYFVYVNSIMSNFIRLMSLVKISCNEFVTLCNHLVCLLGNTLFFPLPWTDKVKFHFFVEWIQGRNSKWIHQMFTICRLDLVSIPHASISFPLSDFIAS